MGFQVEVMGMLKQELTNRMKQLQERLITSEYDAYIITAEEDIWYYTNITYKPEERPFFIIVVPNHTPTLLVPKLEESHVHKRIIDYNIVSYWEFPSSEGSNWYDKLNQLIQGYSRIGIESNVRADVYHLMQAKELVLAQLVEAQRKVKSVYEIEKIRMSAKVCDEAMEDIFNTIYRGASVLEPFTLSKKVQTNLIKTKQFDPITTSLLTAVWNAPASAMPHSIPELGDRFGDGPNVAMAYYRINGYSAECERTFFLGQPTKDDVEMFQHMQNARNRALSMVRAGVRAADIDAEARAYFDQHGLLNRLLHRTGHGVGLRNHEGPYIAEGSNEILEENMVITIEPGIYIEGVGGYRHSDTIRVTKDGYELLTTFPIDLVDMTITKSNRLAKLKGKFMQKYLKL
ncbi:M24 family metallopeptidase [Paenisporosarcina indica]|uniref:M24 family metallopeptidase n=1 Tax=Paenisporosarcina indica TaxID=650093 RepID=UPI001B809FD9|nr:Xaa-Pro peptidase family protein [Paenisporosarcina indica]